MERQMYVAKIDIVIDGRTIGPKTASKKATGEISGENPEIKREDLGGLKYRTPYEPNEGMLGL